MAGNRSTVLRSWKEIAAYLGKGVRTVQRWERELRLPVHRPVAQKQGIVSAVPTELDAWIKGGAEMRGGGTPEQTRAESRVQRAQLVTLRAELARRRQDVRNEMDRLRRRIQRQR